QMMESDRIRFLEEVITWIEMKDSAKEPVAAVLFPLLVPLVPAERAGHLMQAALRSRQGAEDESGRVVSELASNVAEGVITPGTRIRLVDYLRRLKAETGSFEDNEEIKMLVAVAVVMLAPAVPMTEYEDALKVVFEIANDASDPGSTLFAKLALAPFLPE